ncbi:MAG: hypothetical protein WAN72_19850 [Candidatus Acidiferrales bacterium]
MEKYILTVSYWLGVICALLAIVLRVFSAFGFEMLALNTRGHAIDYHSLLDAALLFLFIAMATAGYASFKARERKS